MSALLQDTEEWLMIRKSHIGSSDAPVIMQVSPWQTPYTLWLNKMSLSQPQEMTGAMRRGKDMEAQARKAFEEEVGIIVFPQVVFHEENPWMMASLDGMDIEQKHIVEIKCPNREDHQLAKEGKIPDKYYPQIQHQISCANLPFAYYFSYDGDKGVIVEVKRDDAYIADLIYEEKKFYDGMLQFIPPELTERDYLQKNDDVWNHVSSQWLETKLKLNELEMLEHELRQSLISMAGNSNVKGNGIKMSRIMRKGNIKYSDIPELKQIDIEQYRGKPIESWRISIS